MPTENKFKYDDFKYNKTFTDKGYTENSAVTDAKNALDTHQSKKPGEYTSQWQTQLDDVVNKILNREKFSYDLNGDAIYQQYKDKYTNQAKMAMGDAIGQASAMTGGYGNSYAQSVGQQMYQKEMQNLNDVIPELYQIAYDKYNQEGQDMYNQYAMLGDRENMDYGRYRDSVSDWNAERDYLAGRYDSERDFDYGKYTDDRNFSYGQFVDDRNFAYGKYADDKSYAYNEYRNAIEDEKWQKEFDEAARQFDEDMALQNEKWDAESNQYSDSTKSYSGTTSSGANYNNGSLTNGQVKELQATLGVTADGYYGAVSKEAAGGLSAAEAYAKYVGGYTGDDNPDDDNPVNDNPVNATKSVAYDTVAKNAQHYTSSAAQKEYLTSEVNKGTITMDEAADILAAYGYVDLTDRTWQVVKDGGGNFLGLGINANARVKDQFDNEYSLAELRKELKKIMTTEEANAWIEKLQEKLGIKD